MALQLHNSSIVTVWFRPLLSSSRSLLLLSSSRFQLLRSSSAFLRFIFLRVVLLSFVLEILGGFGTISDEPTSSEEELFIVIFSSVDSWGELFALQVIFPLCIFAGGSLIISELVCGLRLRPWSLKTTLWNEADFVFEFPSILGRNGALFVVLNSSFESLKGPFLSTAGRLLANVPSGFEIP